MYATTVVGVLYSIYVFSVLTLMVWFVRALTAQKKVSLKFKISVYVWITFIIVSVLTFHGFIHLKFPWTRWQILNKSVVPKEEIKINIADYKFHLPKNPIILKVNEPVKFTAFSEDVTYGFGVFRRDGTMVFQMQVVPGHKNQLIWIFQKKGEYTIRSTEYSGPENWKMVLKDAIIVEL